MLKQIFDVRMFAWLELIQLFTIDHPTCDCGLIFPLGQTHISNGNADSFVKFSKLLPMACHASEWNFYPGVGAYYGNPAFLSLSSNPREVL
jgi:hypothetical protein